MPVAREIGEGKCTLAGEVLRALACDALVIFDCNVAKEAFPELASGPDRGRRSGYRERGESYNGKLDLDNCAGASFCDCGN